MESNENIYKVRSNINNKQEVKKMKSIMLAILLVTSISLVSAVDFGNWQSNTTLYSDQIHLDNNTVYGNNAYPIKNQEMQLVCRDVIKNVREKVCTEKPNGRTVCKYVSHKEITQDCRMKKVPTIKAGCMNNDGTFTNALKMSNFQYSIDGENWSVMQKRLDVINQSIQFRVTIPEKCYPSYDINSAVRIA